jgi:hypothetical protein
MWVERARESGLADSDENPDGSVKSVSMAEWSNELEEGARGGEVEGVTVAMVAVGTGLEGLRVGEGMEDRWEFGFGLEIAIVASEGVDWIVGDEIEEDLERVDLGGGGNTALVGDRGEWDLAAM